MSNSSELFVGITSWNSEQFLPACLSSLRANTRDVSVRVVVFDNTSNDRSVAIAREHGASVVIGQCSQADALNSLVTMSKSKYTLLIHADVVMLSNLWFQKCSESITSRCGLVSPEDIGCGPWTRPFGKNKPESSFMFFDTSALRSSRILRKRNVVGRFGWRTWMVDFYGEHVTHNLPERFAATGLTWRSMRVHTSEERVEPYYVPPFSPRVWTEELGRLRYGLGNFYSIDGVVTHYHNWYDRCDRNVAWDSTATTGRDGAGFPRAFVRSYTERFLSDFSLSQVQLPSDLIIAREPKAL